MRNFEVQKFKQQEKHAALVKPETSFKKNSYIPKSTNEKNPTTEHTLIQIAS